jgi:hypothetical protein
MKKTTPQKNQSSKPAAATNPDDAEKPRGVNPRKALFETYYKNGGPGFRAGNAYRSALAAGYAPITAKANCHLLAREARVQVAEGLTALGVDGFSQAEKLLELREAKAVKWNPDKHPGRPAKGKKPAIAARGGWDVFEDNDAQLRTTQEINRILDSYPAPKEPTDSRPVQIIFPATFGNLSVKASGGKGGSG